MPANELIIKVQSDIRVGASAVGTATSTAKKRQEKSPAQAILNWDNEIKDATKESLSPVAYMVVSSAASMAIKSAKQYVNYYLSDIGRQNGDNNYQAQIERRLTQVSDISNTIGQGASGALGGFVVGGPIGAVVGGIIGVATSALSIGYRRANEERAYQYTMFKDNQSQAYNQVRAGNVITNGRQR